MSCALRALGSVVLCSSLVLGCGGGGGGSGVGNSTGALVPLASSNGATAGDVAVDAVLRAVGPTQDASGWLKPGADAPATVAGFSPARWAVAQLVAAREQVASAVAAGKPATQAVINDGGPCPSGGSVSLTHDDADNDQQVSTGDTVRLSFSGCNVFGISIQGQVLLDSIVANGAPFADFSGSLRVTFDLHLGDDQDFLALDGTLSLSVLDDGTVASLSISTPSLTIQGNSQATTLTDLSISYAENMFTGGYAWSGSGTVTDSRLGGSVAFSTLQAFTGQESSEHPSSGAMLITGANGSKVRITVMGPDAVRVEIDADNDGTYEDSSTTTWAGFD